MYREVEIELKTYLLLRRRENQTEDRDICMPSSQRLDVSRQPKKDRELILAGTMVGSSMIHG